MGVIGAAPEQWIKQTPPASLAVSRPFSALCGRALTSILSLFSQILQPFDHKTGPSEWFPTELTTFNQHWIFYIDKHKGLLFILGNPFDFV